MTRTFDATVDFNAPGQLEYELELALFGAPRNSYFSVVICADGIDSLGYVFLENEQLPEISEDDWCITTNHVTEAARMLRELHNLAADGLMYCYFGT